VGTTRSELLVDEAAFTAAFREHYGACLRLARRIVRDEGLAHEVVQEVFLAWWGAAGDGFRADRGGLAAWLSTITHHKAVDAVRTSERQRRLLAAAVSQVQHQPRQQLVDELVWWELGRQSLTAALSTLTPAQQEVLGLAYGTGLTQAEIAERLGIPLGTVKSRTHAGMLRLRAAIGGTWTPTGPTVQPEDVPTRLSKLAQQDRERHGGPTRVSTGTAHADVEVCAAALVRLASEEGPDRLRSAAMVRRAAALVDEHGEAGTYGLLLALARLAAASAASSPPLASTWTADQP
jgi:RNA polymerase sigma-70 factor (ECF subfamily)